MPTAASKAWTKASRTGLLVAGAVAAAAAAAAATVKVSSNPTAEPANATFANGAEECECALDDWASPPPDAERFEYGPGCDFDVLDALPSQQEFDAKYWHRAPVLIRGGAEDWPARKRWAKARLWAAVADDDAGDDEAAASSKRDRARAVREQPGGNAEWAGRVDYIRNDDPRATYHKVPRGGFTLREFLCSEVCSPRANNTVLGGESTDADYVFDRDGWKVNVPYLGGAAPGAPDVLVPPFLAAHFDPTFHYNWSDYLLVSTPGSGLHFHRHPTAYNGLVYGRKRWFFYPASVTQRPEFDVSALEWFRTRARREDLDAPLPAGAAARADGLLQCMQGEGDLVYVPQNWWHATISLSEGIAVSAQFRRRARQLLADATQHANAKRWREADALYGVVLAHVDEMELATAVSVYANRAVAMYHLGYREETRAIVNEARAFARGNGAEFLATPVVQRDLGTIDKVLQLLDGVAPPSAFVGHVKGG